MKTKLFIRLTAAILFLSLSLTACSDLASGGRTPPASGQTQTEALTEPVTAGKLADYFIEAADSYNPNASRAFGELPAPMGNGKNTAPPPVDLAGAPEWSSVKSRRFSGL